MAASMDLAILADVKNYLGETGSDHDALLEALIDRVSEAVETYCGRRFKQETVTEYHDGRGRSRLALRRRPVASVTSLHDDLDRAYTDEEIVDPDDYTFYPDEGIVELDAGVFQDGLRNVKVVYVAGYATVPADLAHAAIVWVAAIFHRAQQGGDGFAQERVEAYSARFETEPMPAAVRGILDAYGEVAV